MWSLTVNLQLLDGSEETLVAVAGMFHCKAKGIDFSDVYICARQLSFIVWKGCA
jgi:hypothetical protein